MKKEVISNAVSNISSRYVEEAADFQAKEKPAEKHFRKHFTLGKAVAAFAMLLLVFAVSVPALAMMNFEPAYDLLYLLSPTVAQQLKPVQMSCEDNGIKFEVISANVEGGEATIFVSVQDLEGDRIDGTTMLVPGFSHDAVSSAQIMCSNISYSSKERIATFLIKIKQWDGFAGEKLTVRVWGLWNDRKENVTGNWSVTFPLERVESQADESNTPQ